MPAEMRQVNRTDRARSDETIGEELSSLADEIVTLLEHHIKSKNPSANEFHGEHHKQKSNTDSLIDFEPSLQKGRGEPIALEPSTNGMPERAYPLAMVLNACPDIGEYSRSGISTWRDFAATAEVVRSMLGVSSSAWCEAKSIMGDAHAAIVVAAILQRGEAISSAGGYLRDLTAKARVGGFSPGPMLMALLGNRRKERMRA